MKFDKADIPIANGVADVDPLVTPASVPDDRIVGFPFSKGERGLARRMLLALEGTGSETVTLSIYALDDATFQNDAKADWKYYLVAASQVITHGELSEITAAVPPGGYVYFRQTAETVADDRVLKVAFAE